MTIDRGAPDHDVPDRSRPALIDGIATSYAFRTEQAAASSLAVLGQYIDAPADADHALVTCDLTAMY